MKIEGIRARAKRLREEARKNGEYHYFTGVKCKNGHIAKRKVANGECVACGRMWGRAMWEQRREELNAKQRQKNIKYAERRSRYRQSRRAEDAACSMKRYADKKNRTPKWADLEAIKEFYRNCPEGHQVDHIIPLRGKLASGLHTLENLQYLTKDQNWSKNNKFEPYIENNGICNQYC
jgi:hypothetical protein